MHKEKTKRIGWRSVVIVVTTAVMVSSVRADDDVPWVFSGSTNRVSVVTVANALGENSTLRTKISNDSEESLVSIVMNTLRQGLLLLIK